MKAVFSMAAIRRKMLQVLERWNESKAKKAFLLVGARQTGKTYIVREFAREHFAHLAEVNFLEDEKAHSGSFGSTGMRKTSSRVSL